MCSHLWKELILSLFLTESFSLSTFQEMKLLEIKPQRSKNCLCESPYPSPQKKQSSSNESPSCLVSRSRIGS